MSHDVTQAEETSLPAYVTDAPEPNYLFVFIVEVLLMLFAVFISYRIANGFLQGLVLVLLMLAQVIVAGLYYMRARYESWWYVPLPIFAWFLGFGLMAALLVA